MPAGLPACAGQCRDHRAREARSRADGAAARDRRARAGLSPPRQPPDAPGFVAFVADFGRFLQQPEPFATPLAARTSDRLRLAGLAALAKLAVAIVLFWPLARGLALAIGGAQPSDLDWRQSDVQAPIVRFLFTVVLGPLLEETAYRLALVPTPWRAAAACGPLAMLLFPGALHDVDLMLRVSAAGAVIGVLCRRPLSRLLERVGLRRLVPVQAALFALVHLPGFTNAASVVRIMPLALPFFFSGLVLAYLRLRLGFRWAWFHHGAYNLLLLGYRS